MLNRWVFFQCSSESTALLELELGIPRLLAELLVARGLRDPEAASHFLSPSLDDLHEPLLMADMDRAVARIFKARDRREKVLIYGDYDVDGITSTVVLKRALEMMGVEVDYHLPKRLEEGYGLQLSVIEAACSNGFSLVITADNGIRAFEVAGRARELGLDLIITDHHLPDRELPEAYAIVNPRRHDCTYPDKNLAAVGVVFKLVEALFAELGWQQLVPHFLKLVAIGTLADVVPLVGENRIIAKFGLAGLADPRNLGLRVLLEGAGVDRDVTGFDVCFKVAPRMNAVTRMGGGREVIELFSATSAQVAESIVEEMNSKNVRRRHEEEGILEEIERRWTEHPEEFKKHFLVLAGRGWHRGVIGIVAARLVEKFYRPVLILSVDGEVCQGSGRSIPGFHLLNALDSCRDFFGRYGGHAQAVGCTIENGAEEGRIEQLSDRLNRYAASQLSEDDLVPSLQIDTVIPVDRVNLPLYYEVQKLAPFGVGNPLPILASTGVTVVGGPWKLKERHLKFRVRANGSYVDAIWWKHGEAAGRIQRGDRLDIAYALDRNRYQGEETLLLNLSDLRSSD